MEGFEIGGRVEGVLNSCYFSFAYITLAVILIFGGITDIADTSPADPTAS